MGACLGLNRAGSERLGGGDGDLDLSGTGGSMNKPLQRNIKWTAETPITEGELLSKREAFWDTAPKYDGRQEIWLALRAACECEDDPTAQAIVDSALITIPTGYLSKGAYDELGNRYVIPDYCLCPPANLVRSTPADGSGAGTAAASPPTATQLINSPSEESPLSGRPVSILLRLSSGKDVPVNNLNSEDRILDLRRRLFEVETTLKQDGNLSIRVLCMGRMLTDNQTIGDALKIVGVNDPRTTKQRPLVLQVMITGGQS